MNLITKSIPGLFGKVHTIKMDSFPLIPGALDILCEGLKCRYCPLYTKHGTCIENEYSSTLFAMDVFHEDDN